MAGTIDSQTGKAPDSQDLADLLIDRLPDTTEEYAKIKEALLRLTEKLKEIHNYYENTIQDLQP